jgi:hypothetical protein
MDDGFFAIGNAAYRKTRPCQEKKKAYIKHTNRKSPQEDQIANELIKYGGKEMIEQVQQIKKIMRQSKIPEEWR